MKISNIFDFPFERFLVTVKNVKAGKSEILDIFTETDPFWLKLGQVAVLVCTTSLQSLVTNGQVYVVHFSIGSLKFRFSVFRDQSGIAGYRLA